MVGSWVLDSSLWGDQPTPDTVFSDANGGDWAGAGGHLDALAAAGACCFGKHYGGNTVIKDSQGRLSVTAWKSTFDSFWAGVTGASGGVTRFRTAVRNGVFRGLVAFDDFISAVPSGTENAFTREVTYDEIDQECCHHVKVVKGLDWLPLVARGPNAGLKSKATLGGTVRQYQYLDAGWGQARPSSDGNPVTYQNTQVNAGESCALGYISGVNIRTGDGTTPGFGCVDAGGGRCGVSPAEFRAWGLAALNHPRTHGWSVWKWDTGYWARSDIQAALQTIYNASIGRTDGPINIRGDLVAP